MFSLLIVLILGALFVWGSFQVINVVTGSAAPATPTATPRPVIEPPAFSPTPTPHHPRATPTKRAGGPPPTPTKKPTPRPTATPPGPPKVFMTSSRNSFANPTSTFHLSQGLAETACWVRNSALPSQPGSITFTWLKDDTKTNAFLFTYSEARSSGPYTGAYYAYVAPGKYRCEVTINGQPFGAAHFTIAP